MQCDLCKKDVKNYISHMWAEHREEMLRRSKENVIKAQNARRKKGGGAAPPPEPRPEPDHTSTKGAKDPQTATTLTAYQSKYEFQMTPTMLAGYEVFLSKDKKVSFPDFLDWLVEDAFAARGLNVFEEQANAKGR